LSRTGSFVIDGAPIQRDSLHTVWLAFRSEVASFMEARTTSDALLSRPGLDAAGRALLFNEARTANTFAPTPVTDDELAEI
jgi:hypothetical protein